MITFKIISKKDNNLFSELIIDKKDFNNIDSTNLINLIYKWIQNITKNYEIIKEISIETIPKTDNKYLKIILNEPYSVDIDYEEEDIIKVLIYKINYNYYILKK